MRESEKNETITSNDLTGLHKSLLVIVSFFSLFRMFKTNPFFMVLALSR